MKTVNKKYEYRGYNFNIQVSEHESKKEFLTVTTTSIETDTYREKESLSSDFIESHIKNTERRIRVWVDDNEIKLKSKSITERLEYLGFS